MLKHTCSTSLSKTADAPLPMVLPPFGEAWEDVRMSVDRFCLLAGLEAMAAMFAEDTAARCGLRTVRCLQRAGMRRRNRPAPGAWSH